MVGDACLTVSLAGSIFFTQPADQSQTQLLLYLLLTIAPFAVVGPIIGPALDRSRAGRRTLMAVGCFGRAAVCFLMVGNLHSLFLFPLAFIVLVLSKGHAVAKSALLPSVVNDEHALVEANSRLSLVSVVASVVGGIPAAAAVAVFNAQVSLIFATGIFILAGVLCTRIPAAGRPVAVETDEERQELAAPSIVFSGTAMAVMRGCVGFLTFQLAFLLEEQAPTGVVLRRGARDERARWVPRGDRHAHAAAAAQGGDDPRQRVGGPGRGGAVRGSRRWPGRVDRHRVRDRGGCLVRVASRSTASCSATARSTCAAAPSPRFETRFQLAWCGGALIPVALFKLLTPRTGFFLLALVLGFAGLSYVGGLRARHEWGPHAAGPHPPELDPPAPPEPPQRPRPRPIRDPRNPPPG